MHGGNLVFATPQDAQSMNATTVFDNNSIWIFEQIYQPLYTVTNDGKGVKPWLATSYTMSSDKKTYTFTLRKGVKFSNGKPMTSADVKFSIDQNRKATQGWAYLDSAISSVDAPSPDTVVIHLKFPWAPLLADLSIFANGDRAEQLRRRDRGRSSTSTRSAPARSSGTTGTRARRSSWSATRTTGRRASPT